MNTTTNTRGVSEAMVERAWCAYDHAVDSCDAPELSEKLRVAMRAALEAALSAEPAAQGEEVVDRVAKAIADAAGHGMREKCEHMAHAAIAAYQLATWNTAPPAQPAERVPEGWVLVPREPTEEMLVAGLKEADPIGELIDWKAGVSDVADPATRDDLSAIYAAMLTASPAPSEGGKGVEG